MQVESQPQLKRNKQIRIAAILYIVQLGLMIAAIPFLLPGIKEGKGLVANSCDIPIPLFIVTSVVYTLVYVLGWLYISRITRLTFLRIMVYVQIAYCVVFAIVVLIARSSLIDVPDNAVLIPDAIIMILFGLSLFSLRFWLGTIAPVLGICIMMRGIGSTDLFFPLDGIALLASFVLEPIVLFKAARVFTRSSEDNNSERLKVFKKGERSMNEVVDIRNSNKNTVMGKIIFIIIFGTLFGYLASLHDTADYKKGQELTLEEYTKDFEQYKQKLTEDNASMAACVAIMVIFTIFIFGLYELLGKVFGTIIGLIFNRNKSSVQTLGP